MRSFGKILGRVLLILVLVIGGIWLFGPVEEVTPIAPFTGEIGDPEAYLAAREAAFDDITPGTEARILWAGEPGAATPLVILNLHGFSATSEEIRPVPDAVADAAGANLVFARISGHGRTGEAFAAASASDWIADTAEALAVAEAVGDRVVIIGTSTGATLAAIAAADPEVAAAVAGIVMVSPNFELANPAGRLLSWPGARIWLPWLVGAERSFEAQNEGHATYWTTQYPSVAAVSLGAAMDHAASQSYGDVDIPLLMIYAPADQVVSAPAAEAFAAGWGGSVTLSPQELPAEGADPYAHVIAGDILSPAMTEPVTAEINAWVAALP